MLLLMDFVIVLCTRCVLYGLFLDICCNENLSIMLGTYFRYFYSVQLVVLYIRSSASNKHLFSKASVLHVTHSWN